MYVQTNYLSPGSGQEKRGPSALPLAPWWWSGVCLSYYMYYILRSPSVTQDFSRAPSVAKYALMNLSLAYS